MKQFSATTRVAAALMSVAVAGAATANPGDINPAFGTGGKTVIAPTGAVFAVAAGVAVDQHDRIVIGLSELDQAKGGLTSLQSIVALRADGSVDTQFGDPSRPGFAPVLGQDSLIHAVGVDAHNRILVAGDGSDAVFVERLLENGTPDPSFGTLGHVSASLPEGLSGFIGGPRVTVDAHGNIYLVGEAFDTTGNARMTLTKLGDDGKPARFGTKGTAVVMQGVFATEQNLGTDVAIDASGSPIISGFSLAPDGTILGSLVKLTSAGTPDVSFGGGLGYVRFDAFPAGQAGSRLTEFWSLALDAQSRIIVAGNIGITSPTRKEAVFATRFLADGRQDPSFLPFTGEGYVAAQAASVLVDASGNIVVTGAAGNPFSTDASLLIYRLQKNGHLDADFADGSGEKIIADPLNPGYGALTGQGNIVIYGMSGASSSTVTYELLGR